MFESGAFYIFIGIVCVITSLFAYNAKDKGPALFSGIFVSAVICAFATGLTVAVAKSSKTHVTQSDIDSGQCEIYYTEWPLISINREDRTTGSFFIGSGSISSRVYYFAYVNTNDGMFLNKYPRDKSYIIEYDEDPKAVTTNYSCKRPFYAWLTGAKTAPKHFKQRKYQLYVPKGTIIRDFTL